MQLLHRYKARVNTAEEADIIYVPFYATALVYDYGYLEHQSCQPQVLLGSTPGPAQLLWDCAGFLNPSDVFAQAVRRHQPLYRAEMESCWHGGWETRLCTRVPAGQSVPTPAMLRPAISTLEQSSAQALSCQGRCVRKAVCACDSLLPPLYMQQGSSIQQSADTPALPAHCAV